MERKALPVLLPEPFELRVIRFPALPLASDEVHLWAITTEDPPIPLSALRRVLSVEERQRADRFRLADDSVRAVLGRGILRVILATYLDAAPDQVEFRYTDRGKPILAGVERRGFHFNVSHSGCWVLIAITSDHLVGVDVEQVRAVAEMESIMGRFFAPREAQRIRSLSPAERSEAFFTCWTRKEAYIKAVGAGLSLPLDRFEVTVRPGEPAALLSLDGSAEEATRWTLWSGAPATGYAAAAAIAAPGVRVVPRYWTAATGLSPWQS